MAGSGTLIVASCALSVALAFGGAGPAAAADAGDDGGASGSVYRIEDLARRLADRKGATYILSQEAQGRHIEILEPKSLEKLSTDDLEQLFSAALTATGLVMADREQATRIRPARDPKGRDLMKEAAEGDDSFVVAVADVDLVGLNRLDRVHRSLQRGGASVVLDHRASLLLAVHDTASFNRLQHGVGELEAPSVMMKVPAKSRKGLLKQVGAVLRHNAKTARRTWSRGGGGSIVGGAPSPSKKSPPPKRAPSKK